jgi:hypothetical protein
MRNRKGEMRKEGETGIRKEGRRNRYKEGRKEKGMWKERGVIEEGRTK